MDQVERNVCRRGNRLLAGLVVLGLAVSLSAGVAGATSDAKPRAKVKVSGVWARTSPMEATNGAVYMVIKNRSTKDNALVDASVPESVATETQIHETTMGAGGTMAMAEVDEITLGGKSVTRLEPGGYHVMLLGLAAPLEVGAKIRVTLEFETGPSQTVEAVVKQ